MGSSPKQPKPTAEQKALERRQSMLLDDEIEESEELLKLMAKRQLGSKALLSGAPASREEAATRSRGGAGGMLGGGLSGGSASAGSSGGGRSSGSFSGGSPTGTTRAK